MFPSADPWGRRFSSAYMPSRFELSGTPIAGGWRCVLDGFQADWEFHKLVFHLDRPLPIFFHGFLCGLINFHGERQLFCYSSNFLLFKMKGTMPNAGKTLETHWNPSALRLLQ